jgi:hypothetical protein
MLAAQSPEVALAKLWLLGCGFGGLLCLLVGPRALGVALWASIVGAFLGLVAVANSFDALPADAMIWASIGLFAGGLLGLPLRPALPAWAAAVFACLSTVVGAAVLAMIHRGGPARFPDWTLGFQRLFVADVAFAALLCAREAWRARRREASPTRYSAA